MTASNQHPNQEFLHAFIDGAEPGWDASVRYDAHEKVRNLFEQVQTLEARVEEESESFLDADRRWAVEKQRADGLLEQLEALRGALSQIGYGSDVATTHKAREIAKSALGSNPASSPPETRLTPDPNCPSCYGHGTATVRTDGITYATGRCRCVGGQVWAAPDPAIRPPENVSYYVEDDEPDEQGRTVFRKASAPATEPKEETHA